MSDRLQLDAVERGQAEGAELVCGGDRPDGHLALGNFVNPTLFVTLAVSDQAF